LSAGTLQSLGVEILSIGSRLRPGKAVSPFGTKGKTLVFACPGNPGLDLCDSQLFARAALRQNEALPGAVRPGAAWPPGERGEAARRADRYYQAGRSGAAGIMPSQSCPAADRPISFPARRGNALARIRRGATLAAAAEVDLLLLE